MHQLMTWAEGIARVFGGPGLFLMCFLDSSLLSFPEVNDLLVMWVVAQHKAGFLFYVSMATLGSMAGSFVVYYLGRIGADGFLRRRIGQARLARAHRAFERWGFFAILVPAVLPPPFPFKVFVLLAGIAAMPVKLLATALAIGRGARYTTEGLLALKYGDDAARYIRSHGVQAAVVGAGFLALTGLIYWLWDKRGRLDAPDDRLA